MFLYLDLKFTDFFEHEIIEACAVRFFFIMSGFKSGMWILVLCFCTCIGNAYDRTVVVIVVKYVKCPSQFRLVMFDLTLFVVTEHTDRLEF